MTQQGKMPNPKRQHKKFSLKSCFSVVKVLEAKGIQKVFVRRLNFRSIFTASYLVMVKFFVINKCNDETTNLLL